MSFFHVQCVHGHLYRFGRKCYLRKMIRYVKVLRENIFTEYQNSF